MKSAGLSKTKRQEPATISVFTFAFVSPLGLRKRSLSAEPVF